MVFSDAVMRERLPEGHLRRRPAHHAQRQAPAPRHRRGRGRRDEGLGPRKGRHAFHALVPAHDRRHRRKARQLHRARRRRRGIIMEFSGKELIKGEPDASSFPSGGLARHLRGPRLHRMGPHQLRLYQATALLYIPTAFCSYGGEALDQKTPLLRSMEALSAARRCAFCSLFGTEAVHLRAAPRSAPEQEYFLVEQATSTSSARTSSTPGRTLFGAMPPKGQEMDDHYFGAVKPRVAAFMRRAGRGALEAGRPRQDRAQ